MTKYPKEWEYCPICADEYVAIYDGVRISKICQHCGAERLLMSNEDYNIMVTA